MIYHELLHVFINDCVYGGNLKSMMANSIEVRIPLWMNEGLAEYISEKWSTNSDMWIRDLAINEKKLWAFNGKIGDYNLNIADVKINDVVNLKIWNNTRWHHAMHLHGHHFWVYSKELFWDSLKKNIYSRAQLLKKLQNMRLGVLSLILEN